MYEFERDHMVLTQIEARGIKNTNVLNAMRTVPRHKFVSPEDIEYAYNDHPLPIGYGQTISQPYIVAYMTNVLNITKKDKVLEIGTGCGYQAAILAELAKEVYSIEIVEALGKRAESILLSLGYDNVYLKIGDGYQGWKEEAPFDAMIITAAPPELPGNLLSQLKDGGRAIMPVGKLGSQQLIYITRDGELFHKQTLSLVNFVPMVHS